MCSHALPGASSLDRAMGRRHESSMEKAGVRSYFVEESQRTSKSSLMRNEGLGYYASKLASTEDGRCQDDQYEQYLPREGQKTLLRHARDVSWQTWTKKHEIDELKKEIFVRTNQSAIEQEAQLYLDDRTCGTSKIVVHQWSMNAT